jgi:hypothetical protein
MFGPRPDVFDSITTYDSVLESAASMSVTFIRSTLYFTAIQGRYVGRAFLFRPNE